MRKSFNLDLLRYAGVNIPEDDLTTIQTIIDAELSGLVAKTAEDISIEERLTMAYNEGYNKGLEESNVKFNDYLEAGRKSLMDDIQSGKIKVKKPRLSKEERDKLEQERAESRVQREARRLERQEEEARKQILREQGLLKPGRRCGWSPLSEEERLRRLDEKMHNPGKKGWPADVTRSEYNEWKNKQIENGVKNKLTPSLYKQLKEQGQLNKLIELNNKSSV